MSSYIDVIYNENIRPVTKYPSQLSTYLFNRFNMKKGDKLLDAGCGRGDFSKGFQDLGLEVFGIDREKSNSEMLKGIEVKLIDIEKDPFPFNREVFDFVFSKSVIEHLWDPEHFIKECYRVLKPGGMIIIMTPDWISQAKIFFDDHTHKRPFTTETIKDLLKIFDFKKVEAENFYQLPLIWRFSILKIISKFISLIIPATLRPKRKFIKFSIERMVLGYGRK